MVLDLLRSAMLATISDYTQIIVGFQRRLPIKNMNVAVRKDKSLMHTTDKSEKQHERFHL